MIKAHVFRQGPKSTPLAAHLTYLRREGVARDETRGQIFDATGDAVESSDFAGRCQGDSHHFRFIVSLEEATELADLRAFTRDLMGEMSYDFGTELDWVAIDLWNTEHPNVHSFW